MTANDLFGEPTPEEDEEAADHPLMVMLNTPPPSPLEILMQMLGLPPHRTETLVEQMNGGHS